MKKMRALSLLLAVILMVSMVGTTAMAGKAESNKVLQTGWYSYYELKNGDNVTVYLTNVAGEFYDEKGSSYNDFEYACKGAVKGKASASWITLRTYKQGFVLGFRNNKTQKTRTGKLTVTGKNYKATVKFVQIGTNKITSATRNKNKVTLKFAYCSGSDYNRLYIYRSKLNEDGNTDGSSEVIVDKEFSAKSYSFKVEKGYRYRFYLYSGKKGIATCYYYPTGYFDVTDVTGTEEVPTYITSWG